MPFLHLPFFHVPFLYVPFWLVPFLHVPFWWSTESDSSALKEHSVSCKHQIEFECHRILAYDQHRSRFFVKEALKIREHSANLSLNRYIRGCELYLW